VLSDITAGVEGVDVDVEVDANGGAVEYGDLEEMGVRDRDEADGG
jgi:hypothetical protein